METKIIIKKIDRKVQTNQAIQLMAMTLGITQDDARFLIKGHIHGQVVNIKIPIENILSNINRQLSQKGINIQITTNNEKT